MPNTFTLIASSTVGAGGASSIDFTSIPSTYTDLVIKISGRTNVNNVVDTVAIKFNSNTSSYTWRELYGDGASAASASGSTQRTTYTEGNNASFPNVFGNSEIYIPNYAGSTNKSYSADGVSEANQTTAWMALDAGLWSNTAAITSIGLSPISGTLWQQYSTAYLYGVIKS